MKKKDLLKGMKALGWWFHREGGNHEIWTNGIESMPVPRHPEVHEMTARGILKKAKELNKKKK